MGVEAEMRSVSLRLGLAAPHIYMCGRARGETWAEPTSKSVAHDPTSQIVALPVKDSPFLTGKKKRIGVSSARLNPATRGAS